MSQAKARVHHVVLGLILAACATSAPAQPVPNIGGTRVGEFNPVYETFNTVLLPRSQARVRLTQTGRNVTGDFSALGLSGTINGRLDGNQLTGSMDGQTATTAANVRFDARVEGDTLRAIVDNNPITLKRVPAAR